MRVVQKNIPVNRFKLKKSLFLRNFNEGKPLSFAKIIVKRHFEDYFVDGPQKEFLFLNIFSSYASLH